MLFEENSICCIWVRRLLYVICDVAYVIYWGTFCFVHFKSNDVFQNQCFQTTNKKKHYN